MERPRMNWKQFLVLMAFGIVIATALLLGLVLIAAWGYSNLENKI